MSRSLTAKYLCDYCGREYTDLRYYCCRARVYYLAAHGEYALTTEEIEELLEGEAAELRASILGRT